MANANEQKVYNRLGKVLTDLQYLNRKGYLELALNEFEPEDELPWVNLVGDEGAGWLLSVRLIESPDGNGREDCWSFPVAGSSLYSLTSQN